MKINVLDIQQFIDDNNEWSVKTFGQCSAILPLNHLLKEVKEVNHAILFNESKEDLKFEFADCFILLMQAAKKEGITFEEVFLSAVQKMNINKRRTWKKADDGTFKHIDK